MEILGHLKRVNVRKENIAIKFIWFSFKLMSLSICVLLSMLLCEPYQNGSFFVCFVCRNLLKFRSFSISFVSLWSFGSTFSDDDDIILTFTEQLSTYWNDLMCLTPDDIEVEQKICCTVFSHTRKEGKKHNTNVRTDQVWSSFDRVECM